MTAYHGVLYILLYSNMHLLITTVHLLLFSSNFWYKYSSRSFTEIGSASSYHKISTLRDKFVEKKYQVFDIIGLLTILVQVNLPSPVEPV